MIPHDLNSQKSFIMGWYADDTSFCDELIELHKNSEKGRPLTEYVDGKHVINLDIKDSFDSSHAPKILSTLQYGRVLDECFDAYIRFFPESLTANGFTISEKWNVQHYPVGGGYKVWHTERALAEYPYALRHLVFMTYLNDCDAGTEFLFQDVKVEPKKGLTLIWPADWTFTHRGIVSTTQEKYIATGWTSLNESTK